MLANLATNLREITIRPRTDGNDGSWQGEQMMARSSRQQGSTNPALAATVSLNCIISYLQHLYSSH
jgi:hypothetical protein